MDKHQDDQKICAFECTAVVSYLNTTYLSSWSKRIITVWRKERERKRYLGEVLFQS